jgi:hypothetical protein
MIRCFPKLEIREVIIPYAHRLTSAKNGVAALRQEAFHADNHFSNASKLSALKLLYHSKRRKEKNLILSKSGSFWRRHPDLNWGIRVLQTLALPLGYDATLKKGRLNRISTF